MDEKEAIQAIGEMKIEEVAEAAQLAFWAEVAKAYPEATDAFFPPMKARYFDQITTEAVRAWVGFNVKDVKGFDAGTDHVGLCTPECPHSVKDREQPADAAIRRVKKS